jgi:hypothetical protein
MGITLILKALFAKIVVLYRKSARALSMSVYRMVRGTASLAASVRPRLLSLAERGLVTTVLPQESTQFPSPSLRDFVTELKRVKKQSNNETEILSKGNQCILTLLQDSISYVLTLYSQF